MSFTDGHAREGAFIARESKSAPFVPPCRRLDAHSASLHSLPAAPHPQLRRRKGSKADSKAAGSGGSAKQQPPKVISAVRDQVYGGGPLTFEQQAENSVVSLLAVIFFVILAEGVFLAGSVSRAASGLKVLDMTGCSAAD
jgi:hypothetical protein